jgi:sugar/nucleoside kinase (ribokinase family)
MKPDFDLLVAGEINPDLILNGAFNLAFGQAEALLDNAALTIGSSSVIFACGAARLGLKTAFAGLCGDDLWGQFMLAEMHKHQIDTSFVKVIPGGQTGLSVILNRGEDRMILTHPGLIPAFRAEDVRDEMLARARHLHVAGYYLQDGLRPGCLELFKRAKTLGLSTSLDTNYDPSEAWLGVQKLLAYTDIFLPNEKEACSLTGSAQPEHALQRLSAEGRLVVMKCGAQGARLSTGETRLETGAIPVKLVDTVGAGDSFDAGFVYGYLNGWPLPKCLRLAAVCGGLSTQAPGGTAGQPSLIEAGAYLEG